MTKEQIKVFLKENKKKVIAGGLSAVLVIGVCGACAYTYYNPKTDNSKITITKDEKKSTSKKANEVVVSDKKEDTKTEAKKDDVKTNETKKAETKVEDKKESTTSNKTSTSNTSNKSSSSTSNKNTSSSSSSSSSGSGSSTTKPSSGGSSSSGSGNSGSTTTKPTHTHTWVQQYKTVHHDAVYDNKYVVDQAAYDEQAPKYEMREHAYCTGCNADITSLSEAEWIAHAKVHMKNGEPSGWYSGWVQEQVGYDTVHHDEVGHYEKVLVKAAYDEKVPNGYKCSCGATK